MTYLAIMPWSNETLVWVLPKLYFSTKTKCLLMKIWNCFWFEGNCYVLVFWCPNLVDILGKWNFHSRYYSWYFSTGFGFGFHRNFLVWVRFLSKPKKWFRWINKQYQTKPIFKMTWKARPKSFHKLMNHGYMKIEIS